MRRLPAMMSFDLGRIELGGDKNLDNVPIERLRREIIAQYERGGMVSLSWHTDNPVTGKDAWDVSDSTLWPRCCREERNMISSWAGWAQ